MTPILAFLEGLIVSEVEKLAAALVAKLPSFAQEVAKDVLAIPEVVEELKKLEQLGAEELLKLALFGLSELKALVVKHVNPAVTAKLSQIELPVLHLSPAQVHALAAKTASEIDALLGLKVAA